MNELEEIVASAGDYVIYPTGKLGSEYGLSVVEGKYLGTFLEWEELIHFIKFKMKKENWFTNVWYMDDHAGIEQVTLEY